MLMRNVPGKLIDGRAFAAGISTEIAQEVSTLRARHHCVPGLAVILVGDDPASDIYVRSKVRKTTAVGMRSFPHRLPATTSQGVLLDLIAMLNVDDDVHGILLQLPLPARIDAKTVLDAIDPAKDVDGFHIVNAGKLSVGRDDGFIPCTPLGCLMLLKAERGDLSGLHAVVIGCSNIVGRPMAQLLLRERCTVVVTHINTRDVAAETRRADIVIVAAGHPGLVRGSWIKPGATVIDVGINRIHDDTGSHIVGDVAFSEVHAVAGALTPVPGGVGPMTIACLLHNTLRAAQAMIENAKT
ncbi:methylene-tetrahydrofolate dehydrogenase [Komagataeibacter diospyri]|uniref:bifunctional 5,10-methylenetetrahydrofolate dehydrogenase/5,10-methenyltetrahydrofolate cyclohydrolase n=1 Tax=Komagataeibacter diospyri TaxID=1932662 RepID=UPI0011379678|nr:bifunctional methylenetetrahydrofolate dehydrogenase/methenyltetrahydrofolate cyclohydrolase FolD [Komagataeibacter diospyri]GCE88920.1 methylene-tetrahydrofolate dehydrogenase [Komagataeibacter diospyri]